MFYCLKNGLIIKGSHQKVLPLIAKNGPLRKKKHCFEDKKKVPMAIKLEGGGVRPGH